MAEPWGGSSKCSSPMGKSCRTVVIKAPDSRIAGAILLSEGVLRKQHAWEFHGIPIHSQISRCDFDRCRGGGVALLIGPRSERSASTGRRRQESEGGTHHRWVGKDDTGGIERGPRSSSRHFRDLGTGNPRRPATGRRGHA